MWVYGLLLLVFSDSVKGLSYVVSPIEGAVAFGVQVRVTRADRFGWLVLYRRLPGMEGWSELQKVFVDRWQVPRVYVLQDLARGEVGWAYRLVWRSGSTEEELALYYPYGRMPAPPKIQQEEIGKPILRCIFPEPGNFLLRGYNSYGEEVFTFPVEISRACTERYQLPPLRKGRYLVRVLEPESRVSLAEIVVIL